MWFSWIMECLYYAREFYFYNMCSLKKIIFSFNSLSYIYLCSGYRLERDLYVQKPLSGTILRILTPLDIFVALGDQLVCKKVLLVIHSSFWLCVCILRRGSDRDIMKLRLLWHILIVACSIGIFGHNIH